MNGTKLLGKSSDTEKEINTVILTVLSLLAIFPNTCYQKCVDIAISLIWISHAGASSATSVCNFR